MKKFVGRNCVAYCPALLRNGGLRFANPPYGLPTIADFGYGLSKI